MLSLPTLVMIKTCMLLFHLISKRELYCPWNSCKEIDTFQIEVRQALLESEFLPFLTYYMTHIPVGFHLGFPSVHLLGMFQIHCTRCWKDIVKMPRLVSIICEWKLFVWYHMTRVKTIILVRSRAVCQEKSQGISMFPKMLQYFSQSQLV